MKRCSALVVIGEKQIKFMIRYHFTLVRKVTGKNTVINVAENMEKLEPSYTADGWGCKMVTISLEKPGSAPQS